MDWDETIFKSLNNGLTYFNLIGSGNKELAEKKWEEQEQLIESLLKEAEADGVSLGIDATNGDEEAKNKVIKILAESTNKIRNRVFPPSTGEVK